MIGNDVVDLKAAKAQSDWRRKGFLEKLFLEPEIRLIQNSENPDISVWNLWSRKEAAYKIFNRQTGIRKFNPTFFACADLNPESNVRFGNEIVYSKTEVNPEFVHTICVSDEKLFGFVSEIPKSEIIKIDGLPFVISDKKQLPASVSHHGIFEKCVTLIGDGLDFDLAFQGAMDRAFVGDFE
ncbi:4'-phosphopantetheinyl transferase superfamily protein [Flavobacterium sp.]|uniref:4'-phosphopantetheinyl transferase family protein n=1 Tax=Flavobacterium sp. TaxID=239 RepID=UPI0012076E04|nr:4'-phosphopantetheinyl transferase superfamily protein [Flavobacterium sp.]RZJ72743.1 MAG: 4-phosphopantetheinyl transferase family protein [Flavobacterium sp.]